jgi:hypothetical protein
MFRKFMEETLEQWRQGGVQIIRNNARVFQELLGKSQESARRERYEAAAFGACVAAYHAHFLHCGMLASFELEQHLISIGKSVVNSKRSDRSISTRPEQAKILHVATNVSHIGGIPRLIWRWISQDEARQQSLALTLQAPYDVPDIITDLIQKRKGAVHVLNGSPGGLVSRAKRLRKIALEADLIVLHVWEQDVVPLLAFGDKKNLPPVIYVNYGDHCFWLGAAIADVVANLRETGMRLAQKRRGISAERSALLPIPLTPLERTLSRADAKSRLGIPQDAILLLSIARGTKYRPIAGVSFADFHVPFLQKHKNAILVVVGPGEADWSSAAQKTDGRIWVIAPTEVTGTYYQAADIYVDSFPFVSNTSLLEAGSYGVPLVSRFPYSNECEVLGADMPGLTGNIWTTRTLAEYETALAKLASDEQLRITVGEATRAGIADKHWGKNWLRSLDELYSRALALPRLEGAPEKSDQIHLGEPDVYLPHFFGGQADSEAVYQTYLGTMPFPKRWTEWRKRCKTQGRYSGYSDLLPDWLRARYFKIRAGLRGGGRAGGSQMHRVAG